MSKSKINPKKVEEISELKVPSDLYKALEANPKAKREWKALGRVARRNFVA